MKKDLYAQIALELQQSNPDQYAIILQKLGHREPRLYNAESIPLIRDRFVESLSIDPSVFLQRRWSRSMHHYRRILLGVLLDLYAPDVLCAPYQSRASIPRKLSRSICAALTMDQHNFRRSVSEVRFFYQTYQQFSGQVTAFSSQFKK